MEVTKEYIQSFQIIEKKYQQILQVGLDLESVSIKSYLPQIQTLGEKYKHAKSKKPRPLTIPAIFSRSLDENFISDYLAYILDPNKNGVGIAPLEAFLKICEIDTTGIVIKDVKIFREFYLENGRIDLFFEWKDSLLLGLENKITSPEGENQTLYYARVMRDIYQDIPYHLVFLTRSGHKGKSDEFLPISYKKLHDAFKNIPKSDTWDYRKLSLWEDFLEHLEVYIMNIKADKFDFSEKANLYIDNHEMLDDLSSSFEREWKEGIRFIESQLLSHLGGPPWETNFPSRYGFQQLYKPEWWIENVNIHFEWWFSLPKYQKMKLEFMVDVEGKEIKRAMELFDKRFKEIESEYMENEILYHSPRKNGIAYKEYTFEKNINAVAEVYLKSIDDFRFLEPYIDEIINQMKIK